MIDRFGNVMIYVTDPRAVADFWVGTVGFTELSSQELDGKTLSVEIAHTPDSEAALTLFDRAVVAQMSPELDLATPSILFASRDVRAMRDALEAQGATVGPIAEHGGQTTFNFADPEGHYFAVREIAD
ncbi:MULTISPECIES: VOC family protein [unclassified Leucobacter]|uniref:VOC family protein n=1 Tax=unclassified Leucobacter TaxID=2621730 RepID=UPI0006212DC3|nr:VOC family protein [Leucobacter sp. Ag1]KKI21367.1 lactoylglutathione lyase [Leucobacter sp. Ag1]